MNIPEQERDPKSTYENRLVDGFGALGILEKNWKCLNTWGMSLNPFQFHGTVTHTELQNATKYQNPVLSSPKDAMFGEGPNLSLIMTVSGRWIPIAIMPL